jgi:hypothetical protein
MTVPLFVLSLGLLACNEYDLNRPGEDKAAPVTDTGEPPDPIHPDIRISPSTIEFGIIPRDCPAPTQEVTVKNVGANTLEVSDIRVAGDAAPSFGHQGVSPVLEPGEEYVFDVEFTPTAWTTYHVDLEVDSNDPDDGTVAVPMNGVGGEDALYEEVFFQDHYSEVDVLWVVDNSCSMSGALAQVQTSFDAFIDQFLTLNLDYHIGVVTTDMDDPDQGGRLVGNVITANTSNPKSEFMAAIAQGANGSADEEGLAAAQAALTEPLSSGDNAGFMRTAAALAVIVVTDEDDSSSVSSSSFGNWFNGLKADPDDSTFSSICGDTGAGCSNWNAFPDVITAMPGEKYIDVVGATGGVWQSICTQDFDRALQHISITAVGMRFAFELTATPSNVSALTVFVDNVSVPYGGTDGWTYDAATNSVVFDGTAIPEAGDRIEVSYPVSDGC